jgi:hypothetical protein
MNNFITTGFNLSTLSTTEDPCLVVKETKSDSKKWGILIFVGSATLDNCIGLITDDTDISSIEPSVLTMSVTLSDKYVGSVHQRILARLSQN